MHTSREGIQISCKGYPGMGLSNLPALASPRFWLHAWIQKHNTNTKIGDFRLHLNQHQQFPLFLLLSYIPTLEQGKGSSGLEELLQPSSNRIALYLSCILWRDLARKRETQFYCFPLCIYFSINLRGWIFSTEQVLQWSVGILPAALNGILSLAQTGKT